LCFDRVSNRVRPAMDLAAVTGLDDISFDKPI
jgi:hypothetical protein